MRADGTATYSGIDLPGTLASMLPALAGLLAELAVRFDTLRPFYVRRSTVDDYGTARHELRLAGLLDQALRAQAAAAGGSMAHAAVNVRAAAMAGSVLRLLGGGSARIVLVAANSHLQRVPVLLGGRVEVPVMGQYLAEGLDGDYVAMAMTCAGGRVPRRRPAPSDPRGMELVDVDLTAPVDGSVEAVMPFAEHGVHVADLRPLRSTSPPSATDQPSRPVRIRTFDSYIDVPVADAFDLVAGVPTISPLPPDER
jgi:erythromycin esterase